ncbi:MAG: ATP-NAD kinase family protein [Propioniciclava sp.]
MTSRPGSPDAHRPADRTVGLIINPVAGLGGPAGLKGSDGAATQRQALARGAEPRAEERARRMLRALAGAAPDAVVLTVPGRLGAEAVSTSGLRFRVLPVPRRSGAGTAPEDTTAEDTTAAVGALVAAGAGLILYVGGDGTARDVAAADPAGALVLGVPAGVKMYSSAFAVSPEAAGSLASRWLAGATGVREAEVLDIDEDALRRGQAVPELYGLVRIPEAAGRTQARKAVTATGEAAAVAAAVAGAVRLFEPGVRYLLGPGQTTAALGRRLGLDVSALGVDVILDGDLVLRDADAAALVEEVRRGPSRVVVTVIGGQGFLLGRGNQQLSPAVIRATGPASLVVVATEEKLLGLHGRPLLVDTGDPALDRELAGHVRVITGPGRAAIYPVAPAHEQ